MGNVVLDPEAEQELEEAADYFENEASPYYGELFLDAFDRVAEKLLHFPQAIGGNACVAESYVCAGVSALTRNAAMTSCPAVYSADSGCRPSRRSFSSASATDTPSGVTA